MEFDILSHRFGKYIVQEEAFVDDYNEIIQAIKDITDDDIIRTHKVKFSKQKSISKSINHLLNKRLKEKEWDDESPIFQHSDYQGRKSRYRIDFAKPGTISLEVAFNNDGYTAWNLIKPTLASQLNHVKKAIQTKMGVVIMATQDMKQKGGFDSTICTMENTEKYLRIMESQLTVPLVIIGLKAPSTFVVEHEGTPKRAVFKKI